MNEFAGDLVSLIPKRGFTILTERQREILRVFFLEFLVFFSFNFGEREREREKLQISSDKKKINMCVIIIFCKRATYGFEENHQNLMMKTQKILVIVV